MRERERNTKAEEKKQKRRELGESRKDGLGRRNSGLNI